MGQVSRFTIDMANTGSVRGSDAWVTGSTKLGEGFSRRVAASGAWTDADTYTIKFCFYETPFCPTLTGHFVEEQLHFAFKSNVGFGPLEPVQLVGKLK